MKKPIKPDDEIQRLATLKSLEVLDTKFEERFDRITRMSKRMFDVPIALVSLVDADRQWFKSCIGLSVQETTREMSFCGHAILGEDVFIIPNTLEDERFVDNPLVVNEPKIRFYAGCPLVINGYNVGTLCIIDSKPRTFNDKDIEALKDLALTIEMELSAAKRSTLDDLTGIANRQGFISLAQNSLNLSLRHQYPVTLVYMDLDGFKAINDNFGRATGDEVLVDFANLLKNTFRGTDIFARIGEDEFVVSLSDTCQQQAIKALEMFRITLFLYNQEHKRDYKLSFSSGIVEYDPQRHSSIEALISETSELMCVERRGI